MQKNIIRIFLLFLLAYNQVFAQPPTHIVGSIMDENGLPLAGAVIRDLTNDRTAVTDTTGVFQLQMVPEQDAVIEISFVGYKRDTIPLRLKSGEEYRLIRQLSPVIGQIGEVIVENWTKRTETLQRIDLRSVERLPSPSGGIETFLSSMGVSVRSELSSQYSVRGGNYDENLIYINDIEIYRPMLMKTGQQEGLSFINPSLISSIQFSAGGFDAQYGDKMSSVLNIQYKRPVKYAGSISAGFLGASAHLEGILKNGRLTHITGIRYKTNQYLLNDLQTKGDYKPNFFDLQSYITYDITRKIGLSFLGNIALNHYKVIPRSRSTAFGTYQQTLNFTVYYEGQESDVFETLLGALSLNISPSERFLIKVTGSAYNTSESVTYDIFGRYRIDLLDNAAGSAASKDSILNLGYGGSLIHARNHLDAAIKNLNITTSYSWKRNNLKCGVLVQFEKMKESIREWEMIDSAGYSIPFSDHSLVLYNSVVAENDLTSRRYAAFLQNTFNYGTGIGELYFNGGLRLHYWNISRKFLISPRLRIVLVPYWQRDFSFYAAAGFYYQPPFYKELRDPDGMLHMDVKAQKSIHWLLGLNYDFLLWERPFKMVAEMYYKQMDNLIPYYIDDIEIQYLPQFVAKGYAVGLELKINGEFVQDAESWASISIMRTREDRYNDNYGDYPRPTDQFINFGIYFQDYLPNNPSYRIHMNMYYGSKLPYSSPEYERQDEVYRLKAYKRVDIGLSKSIITDRFGNRKSSMTNLEDLWFSIEVFNLFDFQNQASYQWIRTVSNQEGIPNMFAVPNFLTGRLINAKLTAKF